MQRPSFMNFSFLSFHCTAGTVWRVLSRKEDAGQVFRRKQWTRLSRVFPSRKGKSLSFTSVNVIYAPRLRNLKTTTSVTKLQF